MTYFFSRHTFGTLFLLLLTVAFWQTPSRAQDELIVSPPPPPQQTPSRAEQEPVVSPRPLPQRPAVPLPARHQPADPPTAIRLLRPPQNRLLFCNTPEKIRTGGAVADAPLAAGTTYTIFYHYRNVSRENGAFVVALRGEAAGPLRFTARQGFADPQHDPPLAGRQAMARFMQAGESTMTGKEGTARFASNLKQGQVASGIITVRCDKAARLRIYFKHDKWTVPDAGVVSVLDPRKEITIGLSSQSPSQYYRIGLPDAGSDRRLDGTYGMMYVFHVAAPEGRRVRVMFSPRGGKAGLVGSIGGKMTQSNIVGPTQWAVFCEATVGKNGLILTTAPFGGVFYPVELRFQLL